MKKRKQKTNAGAALAAFFTGCAQQALKGGIKSRGQSGLVAFFLGAAQKSLGK